jgi:hypothetical protein
MIYDHVNHFFLCGARQIRDWPIHSLLFNLSNFLEWQIRLASAG